MIFYRYDKPNDEKIIKIECCCGCESEINIRKWIYENGEADYNLSLLISQFYAKQNGIFKTIKYRLKVAFNILRGKEYRLTDIELKEENIRELQVCLHEMLKEEKEN